VQANRSPVTTEDHRGALGLVGRKTESRLINPHDNVQIRLPREGLCVRRAEPRPRIGEKSSGSEFCSPPTRLVGCPTTRSAWPICSRRLPASQVPSLLRGPISMCPRQHTDPIVLPIFPIRSCRLTIPPMKKAYDEVLAVRFCFGRANALAGRCARLQRLFADRTLLLLPPP
jgi:hypothetical protein